MATKQRSRLLTTVVAFLVVVGGLLTWVLVADIKPRLGLDLAGGTSVVLEAKGEVKDSEVMDQVINIVRARVDGLGVAEAEISKAGSNLISVDLPGLQDVDRAKDIIGRTAKLTFRQVQGTPGQTSAQTAPGGTCQAGRRRRVSPTSRSTPPPASPSRPTARPPADAVRATASEPRTRGRHRRAPCRRPRRRGLAGVPLPQGRPCPDRTDR